MRCTRRVDLITRAARWIAGLTMLAMVAGCAALRPEVPREPSRAIAADVRSKLWSLFGSQAAAHLGKSGFKVLASGRTGFVTRVQLADAAERSLDLQYYSAGDDLSATLLLQRVAAAAARGVRVRILLDDVYAPSRAFAFRAAALSPNIQVRLFNPFFVGGTATLGRLVEFALDTERLNRRMHNKLWIADNAVAVIGSRNLGDEYFGAHPSANFTDAELLATGPIVSEMSAAFDAYWNSDSAVPLQAIGPLPEATEVRAALQERMRECGTLPLCEWLQPDGSAAGLLAGEIALSWGEARFTWDPPDGPKNAPVTGIEHGSKDDDPAGAYTQRELLIVSPYFIPSEHGLQHLRSMRERRVRVAILTNSLASTDSPAAHAGYVGHRSALLHAGIELYETRPEPGVPHKRWHRWGQASPVSLHAKLIVQDRARVIVGSFNQDPRSRLHNTEVSVVVNSAELAADLAALFDEGTALEHAYRLERSGPSDELAWITEEDGAVLRLTQEPRVGGWIRLWRGVLGAVIPEHLL